MPLEAHWSDVGSWASAWEVDEKDDLGSISRGDVIVLSTSNSHVRVDGILVAPIDVQD